MPSDVEVYYNLKMNFVEILFIEPYLNSCSDYSDLLDSYAIRNMEIGRIIENATFLCKQIGCDIYVDFWYFRWYFSETADWSHAIPYGFESRAGGNIRSLGTKWVGLGARLNVTWIHRINSWYKTVQYCWKKSWL